MHLLGLALSSVIESVFRAALPGGESREVISHVPWGMGTSSPPPLSLTALGLSHTSHPDPCGLP